MSLHKFLRCRVSRIVQVFVGIILIRCKLAIIGGGTGGRMGLGPPLLFLGGPGPPFFFLNIVSLSKTISIGSSD